MSDPVSGDSSRKAAEDDSPNGNTEECGVGKLGEGGQKRKRSEPSTPPRIATAAFKPIIPMGASPPRFITLEELVSTSEGLHKMALAHEIALNPNFKVEKAGPSSELEKTIHGIMHQAFWDLLKDELESDPPEFDHALKLLAEIKEILLSLLMPNDIRRRSEIIDGLDVDLIRQQVEHDTFDIKQCAKFIISMMQQMCAPVQDAKIKELSQVDDLVPLFKGVFETLEAMKLDMANHLLSQARPLFLQQGAEYERSQFQKYLDANPNGLAIAERWIDCAVREIYDENRRAEINRLKAKCAIAGGAIGPSTAAGGADRISRVLHVPLPKPPEILGRAFWSLVEWDRQFPELLCVDQPRYFDLRWQHIRLYLTPAVIMVVAANVPPSVFDANPDFKQQLKDKIWILLDDLSGLQDANSRLPNVAACVLKELPPAMAACGLSLTDNEQSILRKRIEDVGLPTNPVRVLCYGRVRSFVLPILTNPVSSPVRVPLGFSVVQRELAQFASALIKLMTHTRTVFPDILDRVMQDILAGYVQVLDPVPDFNNGLAGPVPENTVHPDQESVSEESPGDESSSDGGQGKDPDLTGEAPAKADEPNEEVSAAKKAKVGDDL